MPDRHFLICVFSFDPVKKNDQTMIEQIDSCLKKIIDASII
jgi:hypothetical protein